MLSNPTTLLVLILKEKVSLRAKRGNFLGKNAFLFMRLLHSVRNDIQKILPNHWAQTTAHFLATFYSTDGTEGSIFFIRSIVKSRFLKITTIGSAKKHPPALY